LGITGPEGIEISRPEEVRKMSCVCCQLLPRRLIVSFRIEVISFSLWAKFPYGSFHHAKTNLTFELPWKRQLGRTIPPTQFDSELRL
jgi:hypothetical protein